MEICSVYRRRKLIFLLLLKTENRSALCLGFQTVYVLRLLETTAAPTDSLADLPTLKLYSLASITQ